MLRPVAGLAVALLLTACIASVDAQSTTRECLSTPGRQQVITPGRCISGQDAWAIAACECPATPGRLHVVLPGKCISAQSATLALSQPGSCRSPHVSALRCQAGSMLCFLAGASVDSLYGNRSKTVKSLAECNLAVSSSSSSSSSSRSQQPAASSKQQAAAGASSKQQQQQQQQTGRPDQATGTGASSWTWISSIGVHSAQLSVYNSPAAVQAGGRQAGRSE